MPGSQLILLTLLGVCVGAHSTRVILSSDGLVRWRASDQWGLVEVLLSPTDLQWHPVCVNNAVISNNSYASWLCENRLGLNVSTADGVLSMRSLTSAQPVVMSCDSTLTDCSFLRSNNSCRPWRMWAVYCPSQGSDDMNVTLTGGFDDRWGKVNITVGGISGDVCPFSLDISTAEVVCRQLGKNTSIPYSYSQSTFKRAFKLAFEFQCEGTERHLNDCPRQLAYARCTEDYFVSCRPSQVDDFSLRLTGGWSPRQGKLQIKMHGVWGSVCSNQVDENIAQVACRELGVDRFPPLISKTRGYRDSFFRGSITCLGNETRLKDCSHHSTSAANGDCDVATVLECRRPDDYSLRLMSGKNIPARNGRLEIKIDGQWRGMCGNIDPSATRVACRQMGLPTAYARAFPKGFYPSVAGSFQNVQLSCAGTERNISDCGELLLKSLSGFCSGSISIVCSDEPDYQVRLVDGGNHSGRLEVKIGQIYGTVCDDHFDADAARVVCRQLGYPSEAPVVESSTVYGTGGSSQIIWLDEVRCQGTEARLKYCSHNVEGVTDCSHSEDVGITCQDIDPNGPPIKLAGSDDPSGGRVELLINGRWGTVCDDGFNSAAAEVVCRQLGLPIENARVIRGDSYPTATGQIFLDEVRCIGTETRLDLCDHNPIGHHDCSHSEDVFVSCRSQSEIAAEYNVRLSDGVNDREGRLEVFVEGRWGTVCNDDFDRDAAKVVCRQLGYPTSGASLDWSMNMPSATDKDILLDDVICYGWEANLGECSHSPVGNNDCSHSEDVHMKCENVANPAAIAGGIIGGIAAIVVLTMIICYVKKKSANPYNTSRRSRPNPAQNSLHYTVNLQYNNTSGSLSTTSVGTAGVGPPSSPGIFAPPPTYGQLFPNGFPANSEPLQAPAAQPMGSTAVPPYQYPGHANPGFVSSETPAPAQTTEQARTAPAI